MALIRCKECDKEISTEAVSCPGCGAPIKKTMSKRQVIGIYVLLAIFAFAFFSKKNDVSNESNDVAIASQKESAAALEKINNENAAIDKEKKDALCIIDLQCASEKFTAAANAYCRGQLKIEARTISKWDFQIGDGGFFDLIFDKIRWADDSKQQIIYIGNNAKFQNEFGAWERMGYSCSFDIKTKKPLAAWFDNQPMPENAVRTAPEKEITQLKPVPSMTKTDEQARRQGPSFDCTKARSAAEKIICSDDQLSSLDTELAGLLAQAKQESSDKKNLLDETRAAWNFREVNCKDKSCLLDWYADRKQTYMTEINKF